ncbi:hypothetical protein L7F22_049189 [Adiantum nelumboides]|nr:hypothetical protein [Adiantum nelumboides]
MRYYGPFQVCDKVNDVAYKLKLPESWKIHNAFPVSLLRPYVGDVPGDMSAQEQPKVEELDEILVLEQVLARKERKVKGKGSRRYLVKFKNYPPMDAKWMEEALQEDFMKDEISKVDELLSSGVNVTIYSGQLDLVCANQGTEAWVQKLRWAGMSSFQGAAREPLYCNGVNGTAAFAKTYKNLAYYWILLAGHMVPADNPCIALEMVGLVTKSRRKG